MAVIDIGSPANDGDNYGSNNYMLCDKYNPANATGTIDTFEVYFKTYGTGVVVGVLYGSGTSWTSRDYESIGNVTSGSKQTFTGLTISVQTNDIVGLYHATGSCAYSTTDKGDASAGYVYRTNCFDGSAHTYTFPNGKGRSMYATGETAVAGNPYYYYLQQ